MNLNLLQRNSLKTRITLFTLLIFLISFWSLGYTVSHSLRDDMQKVLGTQQFSIASLMAADIDDQLNSRLLALHRIAQVIEQRNIDTPDALQKTLEDLPIFQSLFNGGTFITDKNGQAIASLPLSLDRIGVNYIDRDYIANTLRDGNATIGRPVIGRQIKAPVFGMGVPIRNKYGQVIAALAGIINLSESNFMDRIESSYVLDSGSYLLIDTTHRVIVASSNKERLMELLPGPQQNPVLDKFMNGFEGSETLVNPQGIEVISGLKHLKSTDWYVAVALPTAVAFSPISSMERRIFILTLLLTFLSASLTWWVLVRQLRPLQRTANTLAQLAHPGTSLNPLPVYRADEIGQLITGFNRLLSELDTRQERLRESEERYRTVFRTSPDAVSITRLADGKFLDINDGYTKILGWERQQIIGKTSIEIGIWASVAEREVFLSMLQAHGACEHLETRFVTHSGRIIYALVSANIITLNGEICVISVTQDITSKKNASDKIEYLEYFDVLTGIPNLRLLMQRLDHALDEHKNLQYQGALIHIDLNDFKTLNDSYGHDIGDLWLKEVAKRISDTIPEGGFLARISGDKFAVLLPNLSINLEEAARSAEVVARNIIDVIHRPFLINSSEHLSTCSIGIALFEREQIVGQVLLKHAELAMYQAKKFGRGVLRFFDPAMQELISARVRLEADLRESLKKESFVLNYQCQIDENNQLVGFEALIRWHHPERGIVSPGHFIAVAEQSGLIIPLGYWVLETACIQLARWADDPEKSHLTISVNVSATQFNEDDYTEQVISLLKKTHAPGYRLKLELTESILVSEIESLIHKMTVLKGYGIGFSLDDFGTGFSSLSYLQRLPLDQLKIDRSFITDIATNASDAAIAQTIVTLGHSLGLSVIAEGVETEAQRDRLLELGCTLYQGYLYGSPVPIDAIDT